MICIVSLEKTLDMFLNCYKVDSKNERDLLFNVLRYIHVRSLLNESVRSCDLSESLKDMELSFSDKARLVQFPFNVRQFIDDLRNGGPWTPMITEARSILFFIAPAVKLHNGK